MATNYPRTFTAMHSGDVADKIEAFDAALACCDPATKAGIKYLIDDLALRLMSPADGLEGKKTAKAQATLVIAQIVLKRTFDPLIIEKLKG